MFTRSNTGVISLIYLFAHADQNRVEETARWFAMGFWGINSSDNVIFRGIPENLCKFPSRVPDV